MGCWGTVASTKSPIRVRQGDLYVKHKILFVSHKVLLWPLGAITISHAHWPSLPARKQWLAGFFPQFVMNFASATTFCELSLSSFPRPQRGGRIALRECDIPSKRQSVLSIKREVRVSKTIQDRQSCIFQLL